MLSLRIVPLNRSYSEIEVSRVLAGQTSTIATYRAQGSLASRRGLFTEHRVVLNDVFDIEDVRQFGRHGILEISQLGDGAQAPFSLSGGFQPDGEADAELEAGSLLRLTAEAHRQLIFLLRAVPTMEVSVESIPELAGCAEAESASGVGARVRQIVGGSLVLGAPFVFSSVAAAQCANPGDGGHYASGNGYNGVDSTKIQTQEGCQYLKGNVPGTGSGLTTCGFDWGQHLASEARALGLSASLVSQFAPFTAPSPNHPLVGSAAQAVMAQYPSSRYTLNSAQRTQIINTVYPAYYSAAAQNFNKKATAGGFNLQFNQLNVQWQTVFASMYFQAAGGQPNGSGGQRFMGTNFASQVVSQQWSAAMANLHSYAASPQENSRALNNWQYLQNTNCPTGNQ